MGEKEVIFFFSDVKYRVNMIKISHIVQKNGGIVFGLTTFLFKKESFLKFIGNIW